MRKTSFARGAAACALALAVAMPLGGCGSQAEPAEAADTALAAIKAMDGTALAGVYAGGKLDSKSPDVVGMLSQSDDLSMSGAVPGVLSGGQKAELASIQKMLCSFDYAIGETRVDGSSAKVSVTFKAYDFGAAYSDGMAGFGASFVKAVSDGSDGSGEMTKVLLDAVRDEVKDLQSKNKSKTVDLVLTKGADDAWKLNELTKEQLDAMFGGIVSAFR